MFRRIGVLASLAAFAAMLMGLSTAQAQTVGDTAACVFTGLSGQLDDGSVPPQGIPGALPDLLSGTDPLDVEEGTYDFHGRANCAGHFTNGSGQHVVVLPSTNVLNGNVKIDSAGHYDNFVCGTGFAADLDGSDTTVTPDANSGIILPTLAATTPPTISQVGYDILFAAGAGPLTIGAGTGLNPHGSPTGDYIGAGAVVISPADVVDPGPPPGPGSGGNCITTAVQEFSVAGAFAATAKP